MCYEQIKNVLKFKKTNVNLLIILALIKLKRMVYVLFCLFIMFLSG